MAFNFGFDLEQGLVPNSSMTFALVSKFIFKFTFTWNVLFKKKKKISALLEQSQVQKKLTETYRGFSLCLPAHPDSTSRHFCCHQQSELTCASHQRLWFTSVFTLPVVHSNKFITAARPTNTAPHRVFSRPCSLAFLLPSPNLPATTVLFYLLS